jgi:hypothetical protein
LQALSQTLIELQIEQTRHAKFSSSFEATGPGLSQIPESDAQTISNTQGKVISVG